MRWRRKGQAITNRKDEQDNNWVLSLPVPGNAIVVSCLPSCASLPIRPLA